MASHPDANPDSDPSGAPDSPEQGTQPEGPDRESVEDSRGEFAGTAGTGGESKVQDQSVER